MDGKFVIIENVPARVCEETGEQFFSPDTVERLQKTIWEHKKPKKTIETPIYEFAPRAFFVVNQGSAINNISSRRPFLDSRLDRGCAYCGNRPDTKDHDPSRVLLDDPLPNNIRMSELVFKCNNGFSLDRRIPGLPSRMRDCCISRPY